MHYMYMCDSNCILWIKYRVHEFIAQNVSNICIQIFCNLGHDCTQYILAVSNE